MSCSVEITRQAMFAFLTYCSILLCCFLTIQTTNAHDYRILTYTGKNIYICLVRSNIFKSKVSTIQVCGHFAISIAVSLITSVNQCQ